jgi:lysophospholipase L1-like esterase
MRRFAFVIVVIVSVMFMAELALRWAGFIDFPVYSVDREIGYVPAPSQAGSFLNKNDWVVNERSMGIATAWIPNGNKDLLLIGDSLVWGGNPLAQREKLGPVLARLIPDWAVWPASAGSWGVLNEITWLDRNEDVQREADVVVWVLNTADLAERTQWGSELTHPRQKPALAIGFLLEKYVIPKLSASKPAEVSPEKGVQVVDATVQAFSDRLRELAGRKVLIVLYPTRSELTVSDGYDLFREAVIASLSGCCDMLEIKTLPEWSNSLYRDEIHPTVRGNEVFARAIASYVNELNNQ